MHTCVRMWPFVCLFLTFAVGYSSCVYVGCYKDADNPRILPSSKLTLTQSLSVGTCISHCMDGGYKYAGVEDGYECWCGSDLGHHQETATSDCSMLCPGDHTQICGGNWAISVYSTDFVGCYQDYANNRVFPDLALTTDSLTTDMCVDICKAGGYNYAGTEHGEECWCGNSVNHDHKTSTSACDVKCTGDHSRMCGGNWNISVYTTASSGASPVNIGKMPSSALHMVSGLAASSAHPRYLYAINDNAGKSKIYIIDTTDASIDGTLTVEHSQELDWEDIAVGKCPHTTGSCIFVSETGGTSSQKTVFAVKEPNIIKSQNVPVTATYKYHWSEGTSEAIMVDPTGSVYLLSEGSGHPAKIAELPSSGWNSGHVTNIQVHQSLQSNIQRPLAGDISPDGRHLLVKTLYHLYHWYLPDQSPVNAVKKPGYQVPYAFEHEGEAVAWKHDGSGYYTIGQGAGEMLHFYKFKDHPHSTSTTAKPTHIIATHHTTAKPTHNVATQITTAKPTHDVATHHTTDKPKATTPINNPANGYYNEFVEIGHIETSEGLDMTSGLAASRKHPGYLYAINDNGGSASIYMVDEWTAQVVATLHVQHATKSDWEDIAVGSCGFYTYCIYVADTGATGSKAKNVIYKIVEPSKIHTQNVNVDASIHFSWSEASSEAIVADASGDVYIMSDGSGSKLGKIPGSSWVHGHNKDVHVTPILTLPLDRSENGPLAADLAPNGQELLVKTLKHVHHWHLADGNVEKALAHPGNQVSYHEEARGEAIAWNSDGTGYFTFGQGTDDIMYLFRHRPDVVCNWCPKH